MASKRTSRFGGLLGQRRQTLSPEDAQIEQPPTEISTESKTSSRPVSLMSMDKRKSSDMQYKAMRNDVMANYIYHQAEMKLYLSAQEPWQGVVIKKARDEYTCCPPELVAYQDGLFDMVRLMKVSSAMTVCTHITRTIMEMIRHQDWETMPLPGGLNVQIIDSLTDLPRSQLHHFAAFVRDLAILVVWDDEPEHLLTRAQDLEAQLVHLIWNTTPNGEDDDASIAPAPVTKKELSNVNAEEVSADDLETGRGRDDRPLKLQSSIQVGLTLCLMVCCFGLGWKNLAYEISVDGNYTRLALLAVYPAFTLVGMFFFLTIITNLSHLFGPISQVTKNSAFYSGLPPSRRLDRHVDTLPHITIQMPVYKEGLQAVIVPTIYSVKAAISTYEMQGGTANIFVNDDGMQLIDSDQAQRRREFYDEHQIGWVARPRHNPRPKSPEEKVFLRRGKFKKASNMNYGLSVSNRIEDKLLLTERASGWTTHEEQAAYEAALAEVLEEDEGRTWAEGNVRVGDYILIIDSDTRVPSDAFMDAVTELEQSPEVAIIQFNSGITNVTTSFFEKGITWFTNLIYDSITCAVAAGDACPFVGHNAMLRWSAIQEAASFYDEDGYEKFWSESHVSEDFDMALRLQVAGYSLRYASYTGDGFKEGVSLTVYDELARWEKYAYGCNELVFHPFRFWPTRGPLTPLFKKFLMSSIPFPKKITICAYVGTYHGIASAWIITLFNYFLTGWYFGLYDKFYLDSFAILFSIIVVFTALGNVALAVLRYRLGRQSLFAAFWNNFKWIPLMSIFLGGLSLHLSQAILCHFFEINLTWEATQKEAIERAFGVEMFTIARKFKGTFIFCISMTALMIVMHSSSFPFQWQINTFASIFPLALITTQHLLLPVLLNPALMKFSW